jgi:elongation factor Ts
MAVTAAQISELRKSTGAGMLDCKKALEKSQALLSADPHSSLNLVNVADAEGFEHPHEGWVFSFPSLNEELSIAKFCSE